MRDATVEDVDRIESLTLEDFETDFSKYMDVSKMMGEFKMPSVNMEAIMACHRKNMEAFTAVNQAAFDSLTPELREAVDTAGRLTETELWVTLASRLQQNHQRMRERGVTIDSDLAPALIAALQAGAAAARQEWCARSGPVNRCTRLSA